MDRSPLRWTRASLRIALAVLAASANGLAPAATLVSDQAAAPAA